jgi:hypothetical protein
MWREKRQNSVPSMRLPFAFIAVVAFAIGCDFSNAQDSSISPDKKWKYVGGEKPRILEAGTNQVVIALEQNEVSLSEKQMEICNCEVVFEGRDMVVWAPDSKRFGFNYDFHARVYGTAGNVIETPVRRGYTFESVAFYELRGDKWVALQSPAGDLSKGSQLVQSLKQHLPKKFNPRDCAPDRDVLKLHEWTDTSTAILYAPCYGRKSDKVETAFLFTLKFDAAGKWKIVKTHEMSAKEVEKIEKGD